MWVGNRSLPELPEKAKISRGNIMNKYYGELLFVPQHFRR